MKKILFEFIHNAYVRSMKNKLSNSIHRAFSNDG